MLLQKQHGSVCHLMIILLAAATTVSNGQNVESLRIISDLFARSQTRAMSDAESGLLSLWNSSLPSGISKLTYDANLFKSATGPTYSVSENCAADIVRVFYGLFPKETRLSALKMLDAGGKFPSGLLLGNGQWLGTYEECTGIAIPQENRTDIRGNYCLVTVANETSRSQDLSGIIHLGICVPNACNSTDAKGLTNMLLAAVMDIIKMYAVDANCMDNSTLPLDAGASVVIVILCIFGLLIFLGTCLGIIGNRNRHSKMERAVETDGEDDPLITDGADQSEVIVQSLGTNGVSSETLRTFPPTEEQSEKGPLFKFLVSFSAVVNVKKICCMDQQNESRHLRAIHGLRFISMTWIILCHTYLTSLTNTSNLAVYVGVLKRFTFQVIMNGTVSVDTFFVLSGTLLSYLLLKQLRASEGPRNIGWLKFYFHRFWRLTPLYMMVLAMYTTLFKYFGSGPYWPSNSPESCQKNWWTNLLYINNIVYPNNECMGWSWYLANDMQFFLISSVLVMILYKWALLGIVIIFIFMLTSAITTGVITYVNNFPASTVGFVLNSTNTDQWFSNTYVAPWCRINPYLIGVLLGYVMYKTDCKLKLRSALVFLFWCLAAVCNLTVLCGLWNVAKGQYLSRSVNALYASLFRTAWGLGIAWVILACATGNGGLINGILSSWVMIPMSRLTYGAYLFHPIIIDWYFSSRKVPLYVDDVTMAYLFVGHTTFSYVAALVCSVAFEAPLINLERSFIRKRNSQSHGSRDERS